MKKIVVTITGDTPLLMNNPSKMRSGEGGGKAPKIPTPEQEAADGRYLMPDGKTLCLKSDHIHQCIIAAGSGYRLQGRKSVLPYLSGSIDIQPEFISLKTTKYEVDTRRAVLQRTKGVLRSRAKVFPWSATFELYYDDDVFSADYMTKTFRDQIVRDAGKGTGLLDYRPAKKGRFGRFTITGWDV
jgi:hypothetical protein